MEVLDDMKLGKVVKNAGFAQRNVFGADLISIRWAKGAMGVVDNLTKNFFAVMSFQWPRALASCVALAFLNLMPFVGIVLRMAGRGLRYAVALGSMFPIYVGMSTTIVDSALLLPAASDEHGVIRVHHAAFDVLDLGTRRSGLARNFLSAGRLEEGNGVTRPHCGRNRAAENQFDLGRSGPWRSAFRE